MMGIFDDKYGAFDSFYSALKGTDYAVRALEKDLGAILPGTTNALRMIREYIEVLAGVYHHQNGDFENLVKNRKGPVAKQMLALYRLELMEQSSMSPELTTSIALEKVNKRSAPFLSTTQTKKEELSNMLAAYFPFKNGLLYNWFAAPSYTAEDISTSADPRRINPNQLEGPPLIALFQFNNDYILGLRLVDTATGARIFVKIGMYEMGLAVNNVLVYDPLEDVVFHSMDEGYFFGYDLSSFADQLKVLLGEPKYPALSKEDFIKNFPITDYNLSEVYAFQLKLDPFKGKFAVTASLSDDREIVLKHVRTSYYDKPIYLAWFDFEQRLYQIEWRFDRSHRNIVLHLTCTPTEVISAEIKEDNVVLDVTPQAWSYLHTLLMEGAMKSNYNDFVSELRDEVV